MKNENFDLIIHYDRIGGSEIYNCYEVGKLVRCKDCKHYLQSNVKCALIDTRLHFYETNNTWTEDNFCSWGERKG